jgi:hypothetical protein
MPIKFDRSVRFFELLHVQETAIALEIWGEQQVLLQAFVYFKMPMYGNFAGHCSPPAKSSVPTSLLLMFRTQYLEISHKRGKKNALGPRRLL